MALFSLRGHCASLRPLWHIWPPKVVSLTTVWDSHLPAWSTASLVQAFLHRPGWLWNHPGLPSSDQNMQKGPSHILSFFSQVCTSGHVWVTILMPPLKSFAYLRNYVYVYKCILMILTQLMTRHWIELGLISLRIQALCSVTIPLNHWSRLFFFWLFRDTE